MRDNYIEENCSTCKYWTDYSDRVTACISAAKSKTERNRIELRVCRFNPPPTVQSMVWLYTDDEYSCSAWVKA